MANIIEKEILLNEAINRTPSLLPYIDSSSADTDNWGKFVYNLNYDELPGEIRSAITKSETVEYSGETYDILFYKSLLKSYFILRDLIAEGSILRKNSNGYWKTYTRDDRNTLDLALDIYTGKTGCAIYTDSLASNIEEALFIEEIDRFNTNGGLNLFFFVRNEIIGYIKVDSDITGIRVPEYITYSEVASRIETLNKLKNPADCCQLNLFNEYGGQEMLNFLNELSGYTEMQAAKAHYCEPISATVPSVNLPIALFQEVLPLGEVVEDESNVATTSGETHDWYSGTSIVEGQIESKLSRVERRKRAYADDGTELPFALVNGRVEPIYKTNTPYNQHESDGTIYADVLTGMNAVSGNIMTFDYVLQGIWDTATSSITPNTGIRYEEEFPYETATTTVTIGGVSRTYEYSAITYENNQVTIYNEDNGLSMESYIADAEWNSNDIWHQSGNTYNPTFREDYLLETAAPFNVNVDVTVNRGKASAFERYMIMAECNTMEDLYNYKNNFFNL